MRLFSRRRARSREELLDELVHAADADPRELIRLRHRAGIALLDDPTTTDPSWPEPNFDGFPPGALPETTADALTPALVRGAFLRSGCLLVRGLIGAQDVAALTDAIERAYAAREADADGTPAFSRFDADARFDLRRDRSVVDRKGWGGLWIADAPVAAAAMFAAFARAGLSGLAEGYLGERPAISVNKSLLRVVPPPAADDLGPQLSAWHQDGAFLGDVRALNVWVALTRCGDVAPGLDLVPRRLDSVVATGTDGAVFEWSASQSVAEEAAGEAGIIRPVFQPGDVLLFDELFLHATAADPAMTDVRYALECWFFGPSRFPAGYAPLAA